jgi:hypothetical protein
MERAGYLRRVFIGRRIRIAVSSIEMWERLHSTRTGATRVTDLVTLRSEHSSAKPRTAEPTGARGSIKERWLHLKSNG